MKKFLLKIGLFAAIQLTILFVVLGAANRSIPKISFFHAMEDKFARLQSLEGERLIVVGGSNVAFGIDSDSLSAGTEKQVVNMGLHAGIGLDFYLAMLEDCMREGDTILLLPEFEVLRGNESSKVKLEMLRACPQFAPWLYNSTRSKKEFVDNQGFHLVHDWLQTALKGPATVSDIYRRDGFNAYGDIVSHHVLGSEMKSVKQDAPQLEQHLEQTKLYLGRLNRFKESCAETGVELFISYPPISKQRFDKSTIFLAGLKKALIENGFKLLGEPQDFVYNRNQFYDSFYHLGQEASNDRSKKLNNAILSELNAEEKIANASSPVLR